MSLYVDIEKRLGSFRLRVKFETDGTPLALLGASGSGKSMTLRCIAGIETPDCGRIILDGRTLFDSEKHIDLPPQKRQVGYLFQQYALFPTMSVAQNILCVLQTGSRAQRQRELAEVLRRFRLEGLENRLPSQLSGGEQQRTALARILCAKPQAILLDEPFSALDSFLKGNLELELSSLLADFSGPRIWVTHDLGECRRNCGAVCVMDAGHSGAVTDLEALLQKPDSLAAAKLIGWKNFFRAETRADGVYLPDWGLHIPGLAAPEGAHTLAFGPESIDLSGRELCLRVIHCVPDLGRTVLLLRPENAEKDAPLLRVELPESASASEKGARIFLSLRREALRMF